MKHVLAMGLAALLLPVAPARADEPSRADLNELYSLQNVRSYLDSDVRVPPSAPKAALAMGERLQKVLGPAAEQYRNNASGTTFRWGDAKTNAILSITKKPSAPQRLAARVRAARQAGARVTTKGQVTQIVTGKASTALRAASDTALLRVSVPGTAVGKARTALAALNRDWMFVQPSSRAFDLKYDTEYAAWMLVAAFNGFPTLADSWPRPDFPITGDFAELLDFLPETGQQSAVSGLLIQAPPNIVGTPSGCVAFLGDPGVFVIFDTASGAGSRITAMGYGQCPEADASADPSDLLPASSVARQPPLSKTDTRITARLQKRLRIRELNLALNPVQDPSDSLLEPKKRYLGVSYLWSGGDLFAGRTVLAKTTTGAYIRSIVKSLQRSVKFANWSSKKKYTLDVTRRGKTRVIVTNLLDGTVSVLMPIDRNRLVEASVPGRTSRALAVARAVRGESRRIEAGQMRYMQRYATEAVGWGIVRTINGALDAGAEHLIPAWGTFDPEQLWNQANLNMPDLPHFYVKVTTTDEGCIQIDPKPRYTGREAYLLVDPGAEAHSRVLEFAYGRCPSAAP